MQKWEHYVLTMRNRFEGGFHPKVDQYWDDNPKDQRGLSDRLTTLGQEGWELVAAYPESMGTTTFSAGQTTSVTFVLKRPVGPSG